MAYDFTVPTLSADQTKTAIIELQKDLDILNDLALTLKHAHWNVVGADFIGVHEMIDPEIDDIRDGVDAIAERIAALGGSPNGLSRQTFAIAKETIPGYPLLERAKTAEHLKAVDDQYTAIETILRGSIEILDDADLVSSNIIQDILGKMEQFQWKVRSHFA